MEDQATRRSELNKRKLLGSRAYAQSSYQKERGGEMSLARFLRCGLENHQRQQLHGTTLCALSRIHTMEPHCVADALFSLPVMPQMQWTIVSKSVFVDPRLKVDFLHEIPRFHMLRRGEIYDSQYDSQAMSHKR